MMLDNTQTTELIMVEQKVTQEYQKEKEISNDDSYQLTKDSDFDLSQSNIINLEVTVQNAESELPQTQTFDDEHIEGLIQEKLKNIERLSKSIQLLEKHGPNSQAMKQIEILHQEQKLAQIDRLIME